MRATDPDRFAIAARYFPSEKAGAAKPRLFRLTRRQLDLTVDALFPTPLAASAETLLPRDPLQTSYEYADHLGFSSANFTPLR